MPKWKKDAQEFPVKVNYHKARGSAQAPIPKPVYDKLKKPSSITFVLGEQGVAVVRTEKAKVAPKQ